MTTGVFVSHNSLDKVCVHLSCISVVACSVGQFLLLNAQWYLVCIGAFMCLIFVLWAG